MPHGLNYFLAIGIDKYDPIHWPELHNPVEDVKKLGKILCDKYGFQKYNGEFLLDEKASLNDIHDALYNAISDCSDYDNLVVYLAGHGFERPSSVGNFIPYAADMTPKTWIAFTAILNYLKDNKAKHIMLIADCCYSGAFVLNQQKLSGLNMTDDELEALKSRIVFTSGELTKVSDGIEGVGSPFGKSLCQILSENTKPSLRASKLIDDVTRTTLERTHRNPSSCEIKCADNENGEMIFKLDAPVGMGWENVEDKPDFKVPAVPAGMVAMPRTVTASEHRAGLAHLLFNQRDTKIPIMDVLKKERRLVILGSAGSGKSYQMLELANALKAKSETTIPIYLRLNTFRGGDLLGAAGIDIKENDPSGFTLLLDGLDEVPPEYFELTTSSIQSVSEEYPLMGLVVSCRTNFYELPQENNKGMLNGFEVYFLNDISPEDILCFSGEKLGISGEDFLTKAYQNNLSDLLPRPFFLKLLYDHYIQHGDLNLNRGELMGKLIDQSMLGNDQNSTEPLIKQMQKLAFIMEMTGRNYLHDEELHQIFPNKADYTRCTNFKAFVFDGDNVHWMFEHNNIQEYLAAKQLARLPFEEMISLICFEVNGSTRILPTWLNTVAFLSSVGDDELFVKLFDWIVNNDIQAVIRLECDRLTQEQRFQVFKSIFEFYTNKGIWITSNIFSTSELTRFAQSTLSLGYLVDVLADPNKSRITKLNAIHVLLLFDIDRFQEQKGTLLKVLMEIVRSNVFVPDDIISVLGLMAHLKLVTPEETKFLAGKYGNSTNQYLRAGLYNVIAASGQAEEYMDIILDGLELDGIKYPDQDRSEVNLYDEAANLRRAIESITSSEGLSRFIEVITGSNIKRYTLIRDNREVLPKLIENAVKATNTGKDSLFEPILNLYISAQQDHDDHLLKDISKFFTKTNTKREALLHIWRKTDRQMLGWNNLTISLLDVDAIAYMVEMVRLKDIDEESLKQFHMMLFYKRHQYEEYLNMLEKYALDKLKIRLERPNLPDWASLEKARSQRDLDILFDKQLMATEVAKVFEKADKERIGRDEFNNVLNSNYEETEKAISQSAMDIVREFTRNQATVDLAQIVDWLASTSYLSYQMGRIKSKLSSQRDLVVNDDQMKIIKFWCIEVADDPELVWFFLHQFNLKLSQQLLFDLTRYSNVSVDGTVGVEGSLDMLEKFLDEHKIQEIVVDNLLNHQLPKMVWVNHISYAIRKGLTTGVKMFIDTLKNRTIDEYKDEDLLELWFSVSGDVQSLESIVASTHSMSVKWKGVRLLQKAGQSSEFLANLFETMLASEILTVNDKQEAANYLIEMGNLAGFDYLANLLLGSKDPSLDFRHGFRNIEILKSGATIDRLIEMLYISKTKPFKTDIFNDLESKVIAALISVGTASDENAILVIDNIKRFIDKYSDDLPNLNFLYYTIERISDGTAFGKSSNLIDAIKAAEQFDK